MAWKTETELSYAEIAHVDKITQERWETFRSKHCEDKAVGESRGIDISGARAEFAASLMTGLERTGHVFAKQRDLANAIEVRSTSPGNGLLLQPHHEDLVPYLLVYASHPSYQLAGWAFGFEVKQPQYWRDDIRKPAFIRPGDTLFSLQSLRAWYENL